MRLMRQMARVPTCYDALCRAALSFLAAFSIGLAGYPVEHIFTTLDAHLALDVMPAVVPQAKQRERFLGAFLAETLVFTILARALAHERLHVARSILTFVKQVSGLADRVDAGIARRLQNRLLPSLFNDGRTIRQRLEPHGFGRPATAVSPFDGSLCDFFETGQMRLEWTTAPVRFGGFQHPQSLPLRHALPNRADGSLLLFPQTSSPYSSQGSQEAGGKYASYVVSGRAAVRALTEGRASALRQQLSILPLCAVSAMVRRRHLKNEDRWWLTHLAMDVGGYDDIEDLPLLFERIQGHALETRHRKHIQAKMTGYGEASEKGLATPSCDTMQDSDFYRASERRLTFCPFAPKNHVAEEDLRELLIAQGVGFSDDAIERILSAARADTAGNAACLAHYNELLAILEPSGQRRDPDRPMSSAPFFVFGQALRKQRRNRALAADLNPPQHS